jgi:hypothetical protein
VDAVDGPVGARVPLHAAELWPDYGFLEYVGGTRSCLSAEESPLGAYDHTVAEMSQMLDFG